MRRLSFLTTFLDVGMYPFRGIVFVQKCVPVYCSGHVLSFELLGHGEVSDPSPGQQHDEWRLCLLHVRRDAVVFHRQAVVNV